ncbi:MAG: helix-turn-helix domain-containing protein [Nitrosopumilaceae archaeon]
MSVSIDDVERVLVSEVGLSPIQAKIFVMVVKEGKMNTEMIANKLDISLPEASTTAKSLVDLGGFIDITDKEFESMHPRFAAVNMYRRMCEREKIPFKKNLLVDNLGAVLEEPYDDVRTK